MQLWRSVSSTNSVNILAFPCNQFGQQEPKSNQEIEAFAKGYSVEFLMMDKIDVNGPNTNLVYKYLKLKGGTGDIEWNFSTYFVIDTYGGITTHSGIEPIYLEDLVIGLLNTKEL